MAAQEQAKMPRKRRKKAKQNEETLTTTTTSSVPSDETSDTAPKKNASNKVGKPAAAPNGAETTTGVKLSGMKKGESYHEYSKRLAQETKVEIIKATKQGREPTQKRKRYLERRKEKKARKKRNTDTASTEEKTFDSLTDKVAFGEIAERPPTFTAAPKPKKKASET